MIGAQIAEIVKNAKPSLQVQHLHITLTSDKRFAFYRLIDVQPGDSVYARLVSTDDHPRPRIFLSDFGGNRDHGRHRSIGQRHHVHLPQPGTDRRPILNIDGSK